MLMPPLEVDAEEDAEVVDTAGKVAGMNKETMFASRWRSVSPSRLERRTALVVSDKGTEDNRGEGR